MTTMALRGWSAKKMSFAVGATISFSLTFVLFLKLIYYGFDPAALAGFLLIGGSWIAVNNLNWFTRPRYCDSRALTAFGWFTGFGATAAISIFAGCVFVSPWGDVRVMEGKTTLSHDYLIAMPFLTPTMRYSLSRREVHPAFTIPIESGHRMLTVYVQAFNFELDQRDPVQLEKVLLDTAARGNDSDWFTGRLNVIVEGAVEQQMKGWTLEQFDHLGGHFVLDDGIAAKIINARIGRYGMRWNNGTLDVSAKLSFNS